MRLLEEAGLPAGRRQPGPRRRRRRRRPRWPSDPRVDLVSFTGGLVDRPADDGRGRGATVKKVALELGGKNPNIVFADADLEVALDFALTAVFLHSGQVCSAGARLLRGGDASTTGSSTRLVERARRDPARRPVRRARPRPAR